LFSSIRSFKGRGACAFVAELASADHLVCGSAGNFGAPNVVGRANRLEALARENDLDAAALEFEFLETDMNQLVAELAVAMTLP